MDALKDVLSELQNIIEYGEGLNSVLDIFAEVMEGKSGEVPHSYIVATMFLSEQMQEYQEYLRDNVEKIYAVIRAETTVYA